LLLARLLYLLEQEVPQSLGRKGTGVGSNGCSPRSNPIFL
jgi:hypothetical protein